MSVGVYCFFYALLSGTYVGSAEFGTFFMMMSGPQAYFTLILFTFMFVLLDTGLHYVNGYINKWYSSHKFRVERQ